MSELEKIRKHVDAIISRFQNEERDLFDVNASERSLTHKLAEHFQRNKAFAGYSVDCEYNRWGEKGKTIPFRRKTMKSDDECPPTVYPDIIIHTRRIQENNLLVIEVKKDRNPQKDTFDRQKLAYFTSSECRYQYRFGLFLRFYMDGKTAPDIAWYENGEPAKTELRAEA